ncbi:hypothetical protein CLV59_106224 [Chitinophaga dinghuensis]|uniref:Lipoprotein n=1 Tax=Chitinophaga dinghuensis TaxID=1539050 RepID=A0A327VV68_9BACT|nr:hypothetical protein [Chitinophaga dinghuensis]RAJ79163.1 hypothetical protein CLV59_106224 [Chitinophaga dinghuensis]
MNKRYLILAVAGLIAACDNKPKQQENAVDKAAFHAFVQALPLVETPLESLDNMTSLKENHTIEDTLTKYDDLKAGRIRTAQDAVVVVYFGEKDNSKRYWITSYGPDGNKLEQVQIGERIFPDGQAKYVTKAVMENDSIVEFRKYYVDGHGVSINFNADHPSEIRYLAIRKGGKLVWKEVKKETYQTFLAGFPKLTLPLTYEETPDHKKFSRLKQTGSWLDFGGFMAAAFPAIYKVGKIEIPGKPTMTLVLGNDVYEAGEIDSFGPSLILIAFNQQGVETDRIEVTGSFATEGYQSENKSFKMDQDGTITYLENSQAGEYSDNFANAVDERMVKVSIGGDGHFNRTYTNIKLVVNKFEPNRQENTSSNTNVESLGSLGDWNITAFLHTYQEASGQAIRLITTNKAGQILGSVMLDNTFTDPQMKLPSSIDKAYAEYEGFATVSGPVTLTIGDKTYAITKDGAITAQ